jgi:hypothetical protein
MVWASSAANDIFLDVDASSASVLIDVQAAEKSADPDFSAHF